MVFLFIGLAMCLIIGSALILLRTAKMPILPRHLNAQPYQDDDKDQ